MASDSSLAFQDCDFVNNTGYQSGAISMVGGSLTVDGSTFLGNNGPQVGSAPQPLHIACSALQPLESAASSALSSAGLPPAVNCISSFMRLQAACSRPPAMQWMALLRL